MIVSFFFNENNFVYNMIVSQIPTSNLMQFFPIILSGGYITKVKKIKSTKVNENKYRN